MHFFQWEIEIWTYLAGPVALPGSLQRLTSQFKCLGFRDGSCCPSTSADALEPFANSDWQLSFFSHVVLLYFIYLRSIDRRELRDDGSIRFNKIKYISDLIFLYIGDKEWMYRPDDHATMKRKTLRRNTLRNGTHTSSVLKWMETNLVAMNWGARREGTILIPQAERRSR